MATSVLLVEDEPGDASLIRSALSTELGHELRWVQTLAGALEALHEAPADCVLLDLGLPDASGLDLVSAVIDAQPRTPIVVLTGREDAELALGALRRGAQDYLHKSELTTASLDRAIRYAIERASVRAALVRSEEQLRLVISSFGEGLVVHNADGSIQLANPAAARMLGLPPQDLVGLLPTHPRWRPTDAGGSPLAPDHNPVMRALHTGDPVLDEVVGIHRQDGELRWLEVSAFPMAHADTAPYAAITSLRDITERRRTQEHMRLLSAIVDSTDDAVVAETLDGTITSFNRGAERLYGYQAAEILGRNAAALVPPTHHHELGRVLDVVKGGGAVERLETLRVRSDGTTVEVSLTVSPVYDDSGRIVGCSSIARDETARLQAQRALHHQALHDALTGLPNRSLLQDRLNLALARTRRGPEVVAVMFLDIDQFKVVNDGLGHLVGDQLLVEVGRRLIRALRPDDTIARFGGDEFIIVCEVEGEARARALAERVQDAFGAAFTVQGHELILRASIGLVLSEPDAEADQLIQEADAALYRAKEQGRDRIVLFDPSLRDRATRRLQDVTELWRAVEREELRVFYQPIIRLSDRSVSGVEALVRWQHPDRGLVPPGDFIALAEESGLIVPIGRWVLEQGLRDRARWCATEPTLGSVRLSVNLSARQLAEPDLLNDVVEALREQGGSTSEPNLALEITESVLMRDGESVAALEGLAALGISLHIDDFGTGYSSLAYLKHLPVDTIKIDRAFVDGVATEPDDRSIVVAIVALAEALGLQVIAEGVETGAQLAELQRLGCHHAQGYLFSRPMPSTELIQWVRARAPAEPVRPPRRVPAR
ncbi:MAG: EAL domain-containing protein [Acidimicrobiia bacterium]